MYQAEAARSMARRPDRGEAELFEVWEIARSIALVYIVIR